MNFGTYLKEWKSDKDTDKVIDGLVKKALVKIGKDKKMAASYAYQLLEDVNAHSENREFVAFLEKEFKWSDRDKEGMENFYPVYDGKDIGSDSQALGWGIEPAFETANRVLKAVGLKYEFDLGSHEEF